MRAKYIDNKADIYISNIKAKQIIVFTNNFFILNHMAFAYYT